MPPAFDRSIADLLDDDAGRHKPDAAYDLDRSIPCPHCGEPMPELGMAHFSFKPAGASTTCTGLGTVRKSNLARLLDERRSIAEGGVLQWDAFLIEHYGRALQKAAQWFGFALDVHLPIGELGHAQRDLLLYGTHSSQLLERYPGVEPPKTVGEGRFEGVVIEHHLDVLKCADWVIDLGPEGGEIVAQGTPEDIAASRASITGRFLRQALNHF